MNKFACISFEEDKIIVPKEKSFMYTHSKINIQSVSYAGTEGYTVSMDRPFKKCTRKCWDNLERQLVLRGVEYVYIDTKVKRYNPFKTLISVTGEEILPLLSYYILEYIYKYKLIESSCLNTKAGIIVGEIDETIDLIGNIMNEVTDLTLYTEDPFDYKEIVQELNQRNRLKVCAIVPDAKLIRKMDIVFDLDGRSQYALWCNPKAIYIDYKNHVRKYMQEFVGPSPRIWYAFDIVCQRQSLSVPVLQAVLYAQGLTHGLLRKEFKYLNLGISRVYTRRIS